jgi:hypothetical protein
VQQARRTRRSLFETVGGTGSSTSKFDYLPVIIWVLTMTLFAPLMAGADFHMRDTPAERNSKSIDTRMFAVASLSVCIALLFDLILDFVNVEDSVYEYFSLRAFSLISLASLSLTYIVAADYDNFGQITTIFECAQIFGEISCLNWLISSLDSLGCFTQFRVGCIIIVYYFNFISWYLNFIYFDGDPSTTLHMLSDLFYFSTVASFVVLCAIYVFYMYKRMKKNKVENKPLQLEDYYCIIVVISVFIAAIVKTCWIYVIAAIMQTDNLIIAFESSTYKDGVFVIRTALTFFLCLLPGRMFKRKAVENNYDNQVKSSFVSYMSHEIRTPLNVVGTFRFIS